MDYDLKAHEKTNKGVAPDTAGYLIFPDTQLTSQSKRDLSIESRSPPSLNSFSI